MGACVCTAHRASMHASKNDERTQCMRAIESSTFSPTYSGSSRRQNGRRNLLCAEYAMNLRGFSDMVATTMQRVFVYVANWGQGCCVGMAHTGPSQAEIVPLLQQPQSLVLIYDKVSSPDSRRCFNETYR